MALHIVSWILPWIFYFSKKYIFYSNLKQSLEMKNTHIWYLHIDLAFYEAYSKRSISNRIFVHIETCHDYHFVGGKKVVHLRSYGPAYSFVDFAVDDLFFQFFSRLNQSLEIKNTHMW